MPKPAQAYEPKVPVKMREWIEAEVGIAMGNGADVAIESAAITLLCSDLDGIVPARRLSRATMQNIRRNLFLRSCATRSQCRLPPVCITRRSDFCSFQSSPAWR